MLNSSELFLTMLVDIPKSVHQISWRCWLCIYLFGIAPSSLCVLLAYYSSCSCQGSKGGNINPSWGEPHVFGNTSAIWHWSVEEKWLNNNTDVQIAPKHVTCMHACTYIIVKRPRACTFPQCVLKLEKLISITHVSWNYMSLDYFTFWGGCSLCS